ncbi:MAG: LacI family DNA-binding transcriptional regulator [Armatimonadetes bacterium]|nr:LacI family DNA-binding transcriptional regulator [Armatimonadota bacterium]
MSVSLKVISERAGLSISTVSHILNGTGARYSAQTVEFVKGLAEEMGYRPNIAARGLRLRRSYTIGLLVPELFAEIDPLEHLGAQWGYRVLVVPHRNRKMEMRNTVTELHRRQVDGLTIIYPEVTDAQLVELLLEKPTTIVDTVSHQITDCFVEDVKEATRIAVEYLAGLGHKRIGFVSHLVESVQFQQRQGNSVWSLPLARNRIPRGFL